MGKKNPFVTTIGFNRHDPAHVEVAQFLNGMERGKAQYIVDAVMAYQNGGTGKRSVWQQYGSHRRNRNGITAWNRQCR